MKVTGTEDFATFQKPVGSSAEDEYSPDRRAISSKMVSRKRFLKELYAGPAVP